jgi:uncharacterized protein with PQ loop repeat
LRVYDPFTSQQQYVELTSDRSISIACWVVVFSPQIIENFRRQSADGLSIVFIVVWLAGDVFNILGAILQGVLPTMIILAVYYTLADIVLMLQVFYYRGFTLSDEVKKPQEQIPPEEEPLLGSNTQRRRSLSQLRRHLSHVDGTHLSPATPLLDPPKPNDPPAAYNLRPTSTLQAVLFNTFSIVLVCAAGIFGWWVSTRSHRHGQVEDEDSETLEFDTLGQVFGYLCAVLYLGSRVPQLLLNYRRKSTEGVSLLFFLFACIGNLTYDMSIFAYSPICHHPGHCKPGEASELYWRYILVNLSWIAGSLGTLLLDMGIFVQFFMYKKVDEEIVDGEFNDSTDADDRGRHPDV